MPAGRAAGPGVTPPHLAVRSGAPAAASLSHRPPRPPALPHTGAALLPWNRSGSSRKTMAEPLPGRPFLRQGCWASPQCGGTLRVGHRGWHRCLGLAGQWPKKQRPHLWPRFAGIAWLPASLSHAWDYGSLVSDLVPCFSALNATEISGDLNSWTYISLSVPGVWLKGRYGGDCGFEGSVQVKSLPAERMKTVQQKLQCCCLGRVAKRTSHLTLPVKPSQEQALSV